MTGLQRSWRMTRARIAVTLAFPRPALARWHLTRAMLDMAKRYRERAAPLSPIARALANAERETAFTIAFRRAL